MTEKEENAIPESENTTIESVTNELENQTKQNIPEEFDWNAVGKKHDNYSKDERTKFEELYNKSVLDTFRPLSPYVLHLLAEESDMLMSSSELFRENGLEIELLSGTTWKCYQLPSVNGNPIAEASIINLIRDTIGNLADKPSLEDFRKKMLAEVACKSAIRANEVLTPSDMSRLLAAACQMKDPYFCPHGRPTTKIYRKMTVDRWFKR